MRRRCRQLEAEEGAGADKTGNQGEAHGKANMATRCKRDRARVGTWSSPSPGRTRRHAEVKRHAAFFSCLRCEKTYRLTIAFGTILQKGRTCCRAGIIFIAGILDSFPGGNGTAMPDGFLQ